MGSKNVGQVAGMHISTTPPENIKMIWYDSTPSQSCHKVYDPNLKQWVILNQGILSKITYTELKNLALSVGLSVGKFYVITDKGNVLALSITRTKVQYVDLSGNLLVDDLGSNTTYYVSSNNLTIDGENGVFNQESTKLNFNFTEAVPNIDTAYIYGKDRTSSSSSVMRLIKFKLSSLISSVTGNALTWNSGLYFNFNETLLTLGDKKGGVVLFDTYTKYKEVQDQSIENIANNYNNIIKQVNSLVSEATTDSKIMNKKITALQTTGEPIDAASGDSILTVFSKFQRYINKFKYANGIKLSPNYSYKGAKTPVNNNDTVQSAIAKLQSSKLDLDVSQTLTEAQRKLVFETLEIPPQIAFVVKNINKDFAWKAIVKTTNTIANVIPDDVSFAILSLILDKNYIVILDAGLASAVGEVEGEVPVLYGEIYDTIFVGTGDPYNSVQVYCVKGNDGFLTLKIVGAIRSESAPATLRVRNVYYQKSVDNV